MKYFTQNWLVKILFSMWELLLEFTAGSINYVSLSLWSLKKESFRDLSAKPSDHRSRLNASSGAKYSRIDHVKFLEDSLYKIWSRMVCLSRPYHFKCFKGCLPQILLGSFFNIFPHLNIRKRKTYKHTYIYIFIHIHLTYLPLVPVYWWYQ